MHTMDAGWPTLQVAGIKSTLMDYGIDVVAVTDAKFEPGNQIRDLEQMIARKPDVIFSIPIDPQSEATAYKKAASWHKTRFHGQCPRRYDARQGLSHRRRI